MRKGLLESGVALGAALLGFGVGWSSTSERVEKGDAAGASGVIAKAGREGRLDASPSGLPSVASGVGVDPEFIEWMKSATVEEMRAAALAQFEVQHGIGNFKSAVLLRELLRRNPEETYAYFLEYSDGKANLMSEVFGAWALIAPLDAVEAAVKYVKSLRGQGWGHELSAAFTVLARTDLDAALKSAETVSPRSRNSVYQAILSGYAESAPEDVGRVMDLLKKKGVKADYALTRWGAVDPAAAIAWVKRNVKGVSNEAAYLANGIGADDPARGLQIYYELNGLSDAPNYGGGSASLLGGWMSEDYSAAMEWFHGAEGKNKEAILRSALEQMSGSNPEAAIERLIAGDTVVREHLPWSRVISVLGRVWTEDEIFALADRVPEDQRADLQRAFMAAGIVEATPEHVSEVLQNEADWGSQAVRRLLIGKSPEEVRSFLDQVPSERRVQFFNSISRNYAAQDAELVMAAAQHLAPEFPDVMASQGTQHALATIMQARPAEAMRLVEVFPEGESRRFGVQTVVSNLMSDDPEGSLEWLGRQRGTMTEAGFLATIRDLRRGHPQEVARIDAMFGEPDAEGASGAGGASGGAIIGGGILIE